MKNIAVIGLGIMGHGIADNFLKNNYKITVWNRTANKADDLVAKGAIVAKSLADAVQGADLVFEVTANDQSSKDVWLSNEGILANAKSDQQLITCATLSINWVDELAIKCDEHGFTFFDMPMTGGRIGAESGELTLLAGGDETKLKLLEPELKAIVKEVKYFGKAGSGMRYKLILNSIQAVHIAALGEALRMAKAAGIDEKKVGDALAERPGGVITNLAWRDYQEVPDPINFSVEWIAKDLGYAAEMASNTEYPLLNDVQRLYKKAIDQGFSQEDWTKINKLEE